MDRNGLFMTFARPEKLRGNVIFIFYVDNFVIINLIYITIINFTFLTNCRSGTLFVILDIDREILNWLSHLDSKQFSECSWLIILPIQSRLSTSIFPLGSLSTPQELSDIDNILNPLEIIPGKM